MTSGEKLTVFVCGVIVSLHTAFIFIPAASLYIRIVQPLTYIALAAVVYAVLGKDRHLTRKSYEANVTAAITVAVYGITFIVLAYLFGIGTNVLQPSSFRWFMTHLWNTGTLVICGELMRFKLTKASGNNLLVAGALAVALAYGLMDNMRVFVLTDWISTPDFTFGHALVPVTISLVAALFALRGTLVSVLVVSFLFTMAPLLSPVLPNVNLIPWSLVNFAMLFIIGVVLHFITDDSGRMARIRAKRAEKYVKKSPTRHGVWVAFVVSMIAFFLGYFPIYPVVVLTESMAGTFERGSIVFVHRVPEGEAFNRVGEGYIIHFTANNLPFIHRVVAFGYDAEGRRTYTTQGDASDIADPFITGEADVMGVARASLPFFGWPYLFFRVLFGSPLP